MRRKKGPAHTGAVSTPLAPGVPPLVQVAAGLILQDGRYLIARRKAGTELAGLWEFPGGKREPQESLEDCLRRELREELGIEITTPTQFHQITHAYPHKTVELHFFRCSVASGQAQALDCDELRWVRLAELREFAFPEADTGLLDLLCQDDRP